MPDRRSSILQTVRSRDDRTDLSLLSRLVMPAGVVVAAMVVSIALLPFHPPEREAGDNRNPKSATTMAGQSDAGAASQGSDEEPAFVMLQGALADPPQAEPPSPQELFAAPPPSTYETVLRLEKGDTLAARLSKIGFDRRDVSNAMAALADRANLRRLPVGQELDVKVQLSSESEGKPVLIALSVRPEAHRQITLERSDDGRYNATEKIYRIESRLVRAKGPVQGSLIASAEAQGVPQQALVELLRAFAYDVDFQHDMKAGDRFDVLIERNWTEDGKPLDRARMLWGELSVDGGRKHFSVYRFSPRGRTGSFYTGDGESVVKALLRTPLNLSRVSSSFGMRRHPIKGFMRMHTGLDFAAPTGTPVLAAGDGQIVQAGRNGGYGKWVKISHGNGIATGYAHMSRIAAGVKRSARVRQGQVIGFVGSTGLSTGPHLHFELHRGGKPVNPLTVARTAGRERLSGDDLRRFKKHVGAIDRTRKDAPLGVR